MSEDAAGELERLRAEAAGLRQDAERYRAITAAIGDVIWTMDLASQRFTYVSPSIERLRGYSPAEVCTQRMAEVLTPESLARVGELLPRRLAAFAAGDESARVATDELDQYRRDGSVVATEVVTTLLAGPDRQVHAILGITRDLTARRRIESDLRQSEARYATAFSASPDAVNLTRTADGVYLAVNEGFTAMSGWTAAEVVGRSSLPGDLSIWVRAEDRARMVAQLRAEGRVVGLEAQFRRKDGSVLTGLMSARRVVIDGQDAVLTITRDITERLHLEERLRQSQKQEAIGQLAGGIAHDFNNMLAVILGAAEMMQPRIAGDPALERPLEMLTASANRAADLTAKLLGFARRGKMRDVAVDVHREIAAMVPILRRTIDRRISIVTDLSADGAQMVGDPAQIQNLLLNLCLNARDAMPDGGSLLLATRDVPADAAELRRLGLPAAAHLALTVSDTGCGIPPWVMERLFEPFVTTKERGKGTGLGLASIYGAVREHHGAITVDSRPGSGASFRILLPFVPAAVAEHHGDQAAAAADLRGRTVLVADDEDLVRAVLAAQLAELGATVVEAGDGVQAVELFRADPDRYQLVILDQIMPRLNGSDAFRAIHALRPGVRVVIVSGYVGERAIGSLESAGLAGFLAKPYTRAELLRIAAAAMPGSAAAG